MDRLVARDDSRAIDLDPWHAARSGTGRNNDLLTSAERLPFALEDVHAAVPGQPGGAFDPVDLVLLEQEFDALGEPADDPILPGLDLAHVDPDRAPRNRHAPLLGVMDDLEGVRVLEEGLRRDAPPQ